MDCTIQLTLHFGSKELEEAVKEIVPLYDSASWFFTVDGSSSQQLIYISQREKMMTAVILM